MWLKDETNEWSRYTIQRGILRELYEKVKENPLSLANILLNRFNPDICLIMRRTGITLEELSETIVGAYEKDGGS